MTAEAFNSSVWRSIYDQVKTLGKYLKDSRPDIDGNPPQFTITLQERRLVEKEIETLLKKSNHYLDRCKLYPREPKWIYNSSNPTSWASSEKFQFYHLISKKKYIKIAV